ncbi:hypothetical protein [Limosilactobacillus difficilis]|uniref:hypothetical protein n=1 Tax=Limosilactobacillus difficilis TaxID=2991838 RepID=UPI0024BAC7C4|nr:hypothetical protein [Limosilactobacillus difficilis]
MANQKKKNKDQPKYDFAVGDVIKSKKMGPLDHGFTGEVEKVYVNSVMVGIKDFEPSDKSGVNELNGRAIVRMKDAKMVKKVPRKAKEDEADENQATADSQSTTSGKTNKSAKNQKKADK